MRLKKRKYFSFPVFLPTLLTVSVVNVLNLNFFSRHIHFTSLPIKNAIIMAIYWIVVAVGITLLIRYNTTRLYEVPMKKLAKATSMVAKGDFSVFVETIHTSDKFDYLDYMILDFNKMVEELGTIEILKTDFFTNVSHEIKTPLAIIQNYAELLKNKEISQAKKQEYVETISASTKRLSCLITNILKLSKLEKQSIVLNRKSYDLCEQLCTCILNYEHLWDNKNIEIDADLEEQRKIYTDPELIELIWNNLLSNAIKFTGENGTIKIKEYVQEGFCYVEIQDTGCGIKEEVLPHIFEKFYQGDTSHATQGNGLGLALVTRILELIHGKATVESTLGEGTTFTISVPIDM